MANKHWFDVYPAGTPEGDKEQKFFFCLARDPNHVWKTIKLISIETGLDMQDVEKIINKYLKFNMIIKNPDSDYEWAYYERVDSLPKVKLCITQENQNKRIKES